MLVGCDAGWPISLADECAVVFRLSQNLESLLQVRAIDAVWVEQVHAGFLEAHADELGHEHGLDAIWNLH